MGSPFFMEDASISLKQLFQQEFAKMVAVISNQFGLQHIETAEDIVSETFLTAAESWSFKGIPQNPVAWLYTVAKQKTLSHFRRNKILEQKVLPHIKNSQQHYEEAVLDFSPGNIKDSQLQMMFAVCNPAIASEAQIGLALRILCGFGIDEIAEAFFSNKETINKRLFRAKEKLRTENIRMELPPAHEIAQRIDTVLHIIYLLFSEGYYSKTQNEVLRKDLCLEAMRLALMLIEYDKTNLPKTNALLALMCFHASRFDARLRDDDTLVLYEEQDETLWDKELINRGKYYMLKATEGNEITSYHLEARIAYWHCVKEDSPEKWADIFHTYNRLLEINYSPGVAMSRIYALYKLEGHEAAIVAAQALEPDNSLFYFLLLGELYRHEDKGKAILYLDKALQLAKTAPERAEIKRKIDTIQSQ